MAKLTKCPICGGRIQATREIYLDNCEYSTEEGLIGGSDCGVDGETRIYCENDHPLEEMLQTHESRWQEVLSDEAVYNKAYEWMVETARAEGKLVYTEDEKLWEKNSEQLISEGYLDRFIQENQQW